MMDEFSLTECNEALVLHSHSHYNHTLVHLRAVRLKCECECAFWIQALNLTIRILNFVLTNFAILLSSNSNCL